MVDAEIANLIAEAARLSEDADKLRHLPIWQPVAVAAGLMGAGVVFFVAVTKLLGPLL